MTLITGTAGPLLTPEQVESLLIKPRPGRLRGAQPILLRVLRPTALVRPAARRHGRPDRRLGSRGRGDPISYLTTAEVYVDTNKGAGLSVVTSDWPRTPRR